MRFYDLLIQGANNSVPALHFTSHPNGPLQPPDAGALDLEMDLPIAAQDIAEANAQIRIYGISLQTMKDAPRYIYGGATIKGGMGVGLPLANPAQSGVLMTGSIWQAFGNWVGDLMTLDLIFLPPIGYLPPTTSGQPVPAKNLVFNWKSNVPIGDAIKTTLTQAFPGATVNVNISQNLTRPNDETAVYSNLKQFCYYIRRISTSIVGGGYTGVSITVDNNIFNVYDSPTTQNQLTSQSSLKQIAFTDLVGQPTLLEPGIIHVQTVMRSDIKVGDIVQLPKTPFTTTAGAFQGPLQQSQIQQQQQSWRSDPPPTLPTGRPRIAAQRAALSDPSTLTAGQPITSLSQLQEGYDPTTGVTRVIVRPETTGLPATTTPVAPNFNAPSQVPSSILPTPTTIQEASDSSGDPATYSQLRQSSIFQGNYTVISVRHLGRFRHPDGTSWQTAFRLAGMPPTQTLPGPG